MFTTVLLFVLLLFVKEINGRTFHSRQTDSVSIMREKCTQNPSAEECTRIKQQMEDLLRKCSDMITPVSACSDVKTKYCFIWPKELYCFTSSGGSQLTTPTPSWNNDPDWNQVPSDPNEMRSRAEYCLNHQTEQKCRNLMSAIKARYDECAHRPQTDASCRSFKITLCSAFPKFSPCLNGGSGIKRRATRLEHLLRMRRKVSTS